MVIAQAAEGLVHHAGNVAQQLQDSAAADLSPAAWQNAQKSKKLLLYNKKIHKKA